jgi:hypothetical protein
MEGRLLIQGFFVGSWRVALGDDAGGFLYSRLQRFDRLELHEIHWLALEPIRWSYLGNLRGHKAQDNNFAGRQIFQWSKITCAVVIVF